MADGARHLMIQGRVQGVWYRNWTVETAQSLGLTGWVRNRADGSVEVLVEGALDAIERFVALAQDGPPAARVVRIDSTDVPVEGHAQFAKRATA